jgi:hypothetical protein
MHISKKLRRRRLTLMNHIYAQPWNIKIHLHAETSHMTRRGFMKWYRQISCSSVGKPRVYCLFTFTVCVCACKYRRTAPMSLSLQEAPAVNRGATENNKMTAVSFVCLQCCIYTAGVCYITIRILHVYSVRRSLRTEKTKHFSPFLCVMDGRGFWSDIVRYPVRWGKPVFIVCLRLLCVFVRVNTAGLLPCHFDCKKHQQ